MKTKPITRKITRLSDGAHTGWSLYVEDYERAVKAMGCVIYREVDPWGGNAEAANCARAALKAIGIAAPKTAKGAKGKRA